MQIRDRIIDFRRVKAKELVPSEKNWRIHGKQQRAALQSILSEIGYADAALHGCCLMAVLESRWRG